LSQATGYSIAFNVAVYTLFGLACVVLAAVAICAIWYYCNLYCLYLPVDWSEEGVSPPFGSIRNLRPYTS